MSDNPLKPLDDGQVEDVAGGYLFNANDLETSGIWRLDKPYQVIDDKGDVVTRFNSHVDAKNFAKDNASRCCPCASFCFLKLADHAGSSAGTATLIVFP